MGWFSGLFERLFGDDDDIVDAVFDDDVQPGGLGIGAAASEWVDESAWESDPDFQSFVNRHHLDVDPPDGW